MKNDRLQRTYDILSNISPIIAKEVITSLKTEGKSKEYIAALTIQRVYRGHVARKLFAKLLLKYYQRQEQEELDTRTRQVEEGLRALDARDIEEQIETKDFIERQRALRRAAAAITIQRRFRKHLKNPTRPSTRGTKKADKYQKYREALKKPVVFPEEDKGDDSDPEFEAYISKVAGVNIKVTKEEAKRKTQEDELREDEAKKKELEKLRKRYLELTGQVKKKSEKLKRLFEEKADLLNTLEDLP